MKQQLISTFEKWGRKSTHASLLELANEGDRTLVESILLDDLPIMKHVKLFSSVLAGVQHDGLLATRMILQKLATVKDVISNNHPTVSVTSVLGNLLLSDTHLSLVQ